MLFILIGEEILHGLVNFILKSYPQISDLKNIIQKFYSKNWQKKGNLGKTAKYQYF